MTMQSEAEKQLLRSNEDEKATDDSKVQHQHERKASLDEVEQAFLRALLIDDPPVSASKSLLPNASHEVSSTLTPSTTAVRQQQSVTSDSTDEQRRFLNDSMLFTVPESLIKNKQHKTGGQNKNTATKRPSVMKNPKNYRLHVGLWQAHEEGVTPKVLSRIASAVISAKDDIEKGLGELEKRPEIHVNSEVAETKDQEDGKEGDGENDCTSIGSDFDGDSVSSERELRGSRTSWSDGEDDEGAMDHFDAWQVLKDEYAKEHGFDYTPDGNYVDESELSQNTFKIIGTSADDTSSFPHVVSPPLLDSLMTFLPDKLHNQNFWMKYSLVRDGACLDTFKSYARASSDNILAIETTKGHVFGVYTSSPWRTSPSLYGGAPSFVWKMRYNRNTPCHSLIEQATLESEIDVYFFLESGARVQLCTHERIGVGVGSMNKYDVMGNVVETEKEEEQRNGKNYGFAIALEDDLLSGTTSRSACYKSPCFVDPTSNGEPFEVLNLELWTLTPAFSLEAAEKMEMTQYFISESVRSVGAGSSRGSSSTNTTFSSRDLDQKHFYRRLGHEDSHEELRDSWQFRRMMDGGGAGQRGIGASPRFS